MPCIHDTTKLYLAYAKLMIILTLLIKVISKHGFMIKALHSQRNRYESPKARHGCSLQRDYYQAAAAYRLT